MARVTSPYSLQTEQATGSTQQDVDQEDDAEALIINKYSMKPPRNLNSKFLSMMDQREIDKVTAENDRLKELERKRIEVHL